MGRYEDEDGIDGPAERAHRRALREIEAVAPPLREAHADRHPSWTPVTRPACGRAVGGDLDVACVLPCGHDDDCQGGGGGE